MIALETVQCRHRGLEVSPGRYGCSSTKLTISPEGISLELCEGCYCRDHEPEAEEQLRERAGAQREAAKAAPATPHVSARGRLISCTHRGRSLKGPDGKALYRQVLV